MITQYWQCLERNMPYVTGWTNANLSYFPDSIEITFLEALTLWCTEINQSNSPIGMVMHDFPGLRTFESIAIGYKFTSWAAEPGGCSPPVFAKFLQNLPFLPQILAFLCLQPPHVPVSPALSNSLRRLCT